MKSLLIRADDIGYSEAVTAGIRSAYQNGIVKNAGIMVNMPYSKKAMRIVNQDVICFGLHVNLVVGKPCCSDLSKIPHLIHENGMFISSAIRRSQLKEGLHPFPYNEVYIEIQEQMKTYIRYMGKLPEYIDLHGVEDEIIIKAVCDIASHYGILECPYTEHSLIKMPKEFPQHTFYQTKRPYVELFSKGFLSIPDGVSMMVTHPGFIDETLIKTSSLIQDRIYEHAMLCDLEVKRWLIQNQIQLVDYRSYRKYLKEI